MRTLTLGDMLLALSLAFIVFMLVNRPETYAALDQVGEAVSWFFQQTVIRYVV